MITIGFRTDRILNALKHPVTEYQVTKMKRRVRKKHPECAVCGIKPSFFGRNNDVHHVLPVHAYPQFATTDDNGITLCRLHHFIVGHLGSWKRWNSNLVETISAIQHAFQRALISTDLMSNKRRQERLALMLMSGLYYTKETHEKE